MERSPDLRANGSPLVTLTSHRCVSSPSDNANPRHEARQRLHVVSHRTRRGHHPAIPKSGSRGVRFQLAHCVGSTDNDALRRAAKLGHLRRAQDQLQFGKIQQMPLGCLQTRNSMTPSYMLDTDQSFQVEFEDHGVPCVAADARIKKNRAQTRTELTASTRENHKNET